MKFFFIGLYFGLYFFIFLSNATAEEFILGFYAFPNKHFVDLIADTEFKYLITYGTDGQKDENNIKDLFTYANAKKKE